MRLLTCLVIALGACAPFPELDGALSDAARQAPYPRLTEPPLAPPLLNANQDALIARVAALQARAERLRQIDIGALQ